MLVADPFIRPPFAIPQLGSSQLGSIPGAMGRPYPSPYWMPLGQAEEGFSGFQLALGLLSIAGTVTGAYHGYKRNDSVGWSIGWALLGGLFPYVTIPVSIAQGFGKRKR